jgi:cyclin L
VFLAAKLEEAQRRARDVINVFHRLERREETAPCSEGTFSWRLACRSDPCSLELLDMFGREYDSLKAELVRDERLVLRELGFVCHVEHAHKFVLSYAKLLELSAEVTTAAWGHVNDCGRTTLVCRFRANTLACGAIFLAARTAGVALPEGESHIGGGDGGQKPWWILFDVATEDVHAVANVLTCLYAQPTKSFADIMAAAPQAHADRVQAPEHQGRRQVVVTLPTPNGTTHVTAPQQQLEQPHVQQSGRRSRFDAPVAAHHGDGDRGRRRGGPSRSRSWERGARHNQRRSRSRSRSRDRRRSRSRDRRR